MRHFEKLRQQFIADRLKKYGTVSPLVIMDKFDVSRSTASLDIQKFHRANMKSIMYNYQLRQWEKR